MTKSAALLGLLAGLVGCGGAAGEAKPSLFTAPSQGAKDVSSGTPYEVLFPLVDGNLYQYATTNLAGGSGVSIVRVHRSSASEGEWRLPNATKRFVYAPSGLYLERFGARVPLLEGPIVAGQTFPGEHGGRTRITTTDATVEVPAGRFARCVETVEERGGDAPARYRTVYCPGVGMVSLDVEAGGVGERAVLQSHGPPVAIGPDGATIVR